MPDPDPDFLPIPDPGSRGQKGTGSGIRIRYTVCTSQNEELICEGERGLVKKDFWSNLVVFCGRASDVHVDPAHSAILFRDARGVSPLCLDCF
jgi:hypothetical protein